MKLPEPPPDHAGLLRDLPRGRLSAVFPHQVTVSGSYLHWDQIRHRPPPGDLTHAEWWLGVRLARAGAMEFLPFKQKDGRAFGFVHAPPIREGLHRIDQSFGMSAGPGGAVRDIVDAHGTSYLLVNSLMEAKYARAYLHTETDDGDVTYFLDHQIGVIRKSIESLEQYVQKKAEDIRDLAPRGLLFQSKEGRQFVFIAPNDLRQR